jgi:hypothetical protein
LRTAGGGNAADAHFGLAKLRIGGCDTNVARERKLHSPGEREAVHRADHRLVDFHAGKWIEPFRPTEGQLGEALFRRHGLLQVGARAERRFAGSRQDDDADVLIGIGPLKRVVQFDQRLRVERIHRLGAVERYGCDAFVDFILDGHHCTS